jgi:hypothetical protein
MSTIRWEECSNLVELAPDVEYGEHHGIHEHGNGHYQRHSHTDRRRDSSTSGLRVRVADPDWIRIQSGQWIRIRIRNPDPDRGGQK